MSVLVKIAAVAEGERLVAARHLPEAVQCFHEAEAAGADANRCAAGRWMTYMLAGQFESAWLESDVIRRRDAPDPNRFWQGESLSGKRVILRCLHGLGDATQFLCYVPQLRAIVSSLLVEVPPRFVELAHCFAGVEQVITWDAPTPSQPPLWDVQIEVMELPYIFRTQPSDLPLATKYLHLPATPALQVDQSNRLRVGLAWSAGTWDPARSIDTEALLPIVAVEGCEFWDLEGGLHDAQRNRSIALPLRQEIACRDSIEGLAAMISQLDLVITVDTLAAHIAGALGVDAWVLLRHEADWRWMHDRSDSPWYPSLKLFRQSVPGNWDSVIAAVSQALQTEVSRYETEAVEDE